MPKTTEVGYLDDTVTVEEQEPATLEELVTLYGADAVKEEAISNWRYRNKHPRVYRKASAEIAKTSPRRVVKEEEKKDKEGNVIGTKQILVSHLDHLREARKAHASLVDETITKFALEEPLFVERERTGIGRLSASALNNANNFFAEGTEKVEGVVAAIESAVPGFKVGRDEENEVTPETLARGLQALGKHAARQAEKNALAQVGATKE